MFELPKLADLKIKKEAIISNVSLPAAWSSDPAEKLQVAKHCLFNSAAWLLGEHLRDVLAPHYASAVDMAVMMGDDAVVEVEKAFGQAAGSLGELVELKLKAYLPKSGDEGKWLVKFGIVNADWYALAGVPYDATEIPEHLKRDAPAAKPTPAEQIAEHVLSAPPILAAPPLPPEGAAHDADDHGGTPHDSAGEIDVMAALKAYNTALTFNADFFAGIMGVSRTTASNWLGGKPVKKIKAEQIEALKADTVKRIKMLDSALAALGA